MYTPTRHNQNHNSSPNLRTDRTTIVNGSVVSRPSQKAYANTEPKTYTAPMPQNYKNKTKQSPTPRKTTQTNKQETTKGLRHMSRAELIEIIYALEQDNLNLKKENKKLQTELADKNIRIANSGSIAQAALDLNNIFEDAEAAAQQYLYSIKQQTENNQKNDEADNYIPHGRHAR